MVLENPATRRKKMRLPKGLYCFDPNHPDTNGMIEYFVSRLGGIRSAVGILGLERVQWVHPDCGFWMLHRSIAERKLTALVRGRDLFLGQGG
jgi:5-methyltetrahydropteroyltriglutamate--homocysteine methyltransferase